MPERLSRFARQLEVFLANPRKVLDACLALQNLSCNNIGVAHPELAFSTEPLAANAIRASLKSNGGQMRWLKSCC